MAPPRIYCCSNGCLNSSVKRPELSFFKLPSEEERRNQWLALICREDLAGKKAKSYVVCEEHFLAHEILRTEHRKNLKKNALPSLNLPGDAFKYQVVAFEIPLKVECGTQTAESHLDSSLRHPSSHASASNTRKRKLKSNKLQQVKKIKLEVDNQSRKLQKKLFDELCDKFLTIEFAELVKNKKLEDPNAKKQYLSISTEVDEKIIDILKIKVDNMTENEKICSLILDTMNLRSNLVYNTKLDRFIGFHEIDGVQTGDPATMALVLMLRGIVNNWQQPVGFALLSEYRDYEGITKWIDKLTDRLCNIGFDVRAIISNMESDMYNLAKERSISPEKPFFTLFKLKKLFYVFDASNLVIMVRNSFLENDFNFQGCVANMEPVKHFYTQDKEKSCSLVPKLTESHVNPNNEQKKELRFAVQLLSNSVAAAILTYIDFYVIDESGRDTVKFIKLMNDLFDSLSSTNIKDINVFKKAFNGDPAQVKLFDEAIKLFRVLKLVDPKTGSDVTSSAKFIEGFQITIGSIMLLLEDLGKKRITHLQTRRLSTNATGKLFSQIKVISGASGDPTSRQFVSAFKELFLKELMKPPAGNDCTMDIARVLAASNSKDSDDDTYELNESTSVINDESNNHIKVKNCEYNQIEINDKNNAVYISSYLLKRCSEKHKDCQILNSYIAPTPEQRIYNFSTDARYQRYREYCEKTCTSLLVVPYDDFIRYVEMMEKEFRSCFKKKRIEKEVAANIYKEISELNFLPPCLCFPMVYLKKLFIRMRIFHTVQFNNKKWRTSFSKRKYFAVPNL